MNTTACIKIILATTALSLLFWGDADWIKPMQVPDLALISPDARPDMQSKSDTIPEITPPPPALAPGHAKVLAVITTFDRVQMNTRKEEGRLLLKVKKVLGYGAATPPIAVSDTLKVGIGNPEEIEIHIGKIVSAVISYQERPNINFSHALPWTLVTLEVDSN